MPKPQYAVLSDDEKSVTVDVEWFINMAVYKIEIKAVDEYLKRAREKVNK